MPEVSIPEEAERLALEAMRAVDADSDAAEDFKASAAVRAAAPLIVAAHESREIERLTGFLARVGWELCESCNGRGGTATADEVFPCGDCGGFCLQQIEDEPDEEHADRRDPWTLTPDDVALRASVLRGEGDQK